MNRKLTWAADGDSRKNRREEVGTSRKAKKGEDFDLCLGLDAKG